MIDIQSDVSVIICAYTEDRWEQLKKSVMSVKKQTLSPLEIIVVVDHNPNLLRRVDGELTGILAFHNLEAPGLSGARNTGIRFAKGEIIAFLDEDAVASPDWLETLLLEYDNQEVMGVGGAIIPEWINQKPDWFPPEFYWVVGCTYEGLPTKKSQVRNLIGCNMSFRREILWEAGGFRNGMGRVMTLPKGCEETELCIRAFRLFQTGFFLFQPDAKVFHEVPQARIQWRYFISRCFAEGLSKAQVSNFVGKKNGLQSERAYTMKTLPKGFLNYLSAGLRLRQKALILRALAIVSGLLITTGGYLIGNLSLRKHTLNVLPSSLPPIETYHYEMDRNQ